MVNSMAFWHLIAKFRWISVKYNKLLILKFQGSPKINILGHAKNSPVVLIKSTFKQVSLSINCPLVWPFSIQPWSLTLRAAYSRLPKQQLLFPLSITLLLRLSHPLNQLLAFPVLWVGLLWLLWQYYSSKVLMSCCLLLKSSKWFIFITSWINNFPTTSVAFWSISRLLTSSSCQTLSAQSSLPTTLHQLLQFISN